MKLLSFFLLLLLAHAPAFGETLPALSEALAARTQRVPEFQFIREEAKRLGVRAWLFGGTAAAYGHYVKWDLEREAGLSPYQPERFDYDYTNIYRSTQDLDIVIDGNPKQADELRASLAKAYPHFLGAKGNSAWEIRLLRQTVGDKLAILDNPDFLNQHSDSHSTGMLEITPTPKGESPVRDVMDWNSHEPNFLKDVRENQLHYYFNPKHGTTRFAREGRNPPILSVIRYLTKALQFESELRPEDLAQVKKIIADFDPSGSDAKNDYVRRWLLEKDNGRKLVQNALSMEHARKLLDETGLRQKLLAIPGADPQTVGSLGWWLNKEPLRSLPLGRGDGKTAGELGIAVVAHETNSFAAYESITKSPRGAPNVFISRPNSPGEGAVYGPGFYTREGRMGARGTGITIRFHLDPKAREGSDFVREGDFVIVRNRNALTVIPESLNWDYPKYIRFVLDATGFDSSNKAQFEKLSRRLRNQAKSYTPADFRRMIVEASAEIADGGRVPDPVALHTLLEVHLGRDPAEMQTAVTEISAAVRQGLHQSLSAPMALTSSDFRNILALENDLDLGDEVREALLRIAREAPAYRDLEIIQKRFGDEVYLDALTTIAKSREPSYKNAAHALAEAHDPRARERSAVVAAAWLRYDGGFPEKEMKALAQNAPEVRAVLRDWLRDLSAPGTWSPEEREVFTRFLEHNRHLVKAMGDWSRSHGGITCAAAFAGLERRVRYPLATLNLAGAAVGGTWLLQDEYDFAKYQPLIEAEMPKLAKAFAEAKDADDYLKALAALPFPVPANPSERTHGEYIWRTRVSNLAVHHCEQFLSRARTTAELSRYAPYVLDSGYCQEKLWERLRQGYARPAELLHAAIPPSAIPWDKDALNLTWGKSLDIFFAGKPSADEIRALYQQTLPNGIDPIYKGIGRADSPADLLKLYEGNGQLRLNGVTRALGKMMDFDPSSDEIGRFAKTIERQQKGASVPLRLKYADDPQPLLHQAVGATDDEMLPFLYRGIVEAKGRRIRAEDVRRELTGCETVACARLQIVATAAARNPLEYVDAVAKIPPPKQDFFLWDDAVKHFWDLHPSTVDVIALRHAMENIPGWSNFAEKALEYAEAPDQRALFLRTAKADVESGGFRMSLLRQRTGGSTP